MGRKRKYNKVDINGPETKIWLNGKNGKGRYALIDTRFLYKVRRYNWHAKLESTNRNIINSVACVNEDKKTIRLHRAIMGIKDPGIIIDHINGNTLDNRTSNLRVCTSGENSRNHNNLKPGKVCRFKGVTFDKRYNSYISRIMINGTSKYLGCFKSEIDAAKTYDEAAIKYHGVFAKTNEQLGLLKMRQ